MDGVESEVQKIRNARKAERARNYRQRKKANRKATDDRIKNLTHENQNMTEKLAKLEHIVFLMRVHCFDMFIKARIQKGEIN